MSYFHTVGLELSRRCNANCLHCVTGANSNIKSKMSYKQIDNVLREISYNFNSISFTGGEPFVCLDELEYAVNKCSNLNIKNVVLTNCFWAKSFNEAKNILKNIKTDFLEISSDIFHQKVIPFENVLNTIFACKDLKYNFKIRTLHVGFNKNAEKKSLTQFKSKLKKNGIEEVAVASTPILIFDNNMDIFNSLPIVYSSKAPNKNTCLSLKNLFISAEGYLYPCCSSLIRLKAKDNIVIGNVFEEPLNGMLERLKNNFLFNMLMYYGPQGLIKLLIKIGYTDLANSLICNLQYNDVCHLCSRLFSNKKAMSILKSFKNEN